jgi:glycerol kinase
MQRDTGITLRQLQVDGGACANDFLMQFQADILGVAVERPQLIESTAQGAAYLAGIAAGIWNPDRIRALRKTDRLFKPAMDADRRDALIAQWNEAVRRTMHWLKP